MIKRNLIYSARIYFLVTMFSLIMVNPVLGYYKKMDQVPQKYRKELNKVRVEKGSIILFDQFRKRELKGKGDAGYTLKFMCESKRPRKGKECKLIEYELLGPQK